ASRAGGSIPRALPSQCLPGLPPMTTPDCSRRFYVPGWPNGGTEKEKGPAWGPFLQLRPGPKAYLIFASLYATCLRTTGSYLRNSILFGVVFLFLSVV